MKIADYKDYWQVSNVGVIALFSRDSGRPMTDAKTDALRHVVLSLLLAVETDSSHTSRLASAAATNTARCTLCERLRHRLLHRENVVSRCLL